MRTQNRSCWKRDENLPTYFDTTHDEMVVKAFHSGRVTEVTTKLDRCIFLNRHTHIHTHVRTCKPMHAHIRTCTCSITEPLVRWLVHWKYARPVLEVRSRCGRGTLEVRSRYTREVPSGVTSLGKGNSQD